jgi:hypothetical protein
MLGLKVVVDPLAETRVWVYPTDEPFVEYIPSPETERWCRFFGYGHEERRPCAYRIGNTLIVHPSVYEAMKKEFAR